MYRRIKDFREDNDLSQKQMGKILNVSRAGYSGYENGGRNVPIQIIEAIADYFNTSIDYLLERTDEPVPYPRSKNLK